LTPVLVILRALACAVRRDLGSFESLKLNNLVLFVLLLIAGALSSHVEPASAEPLIFLLVLLLLFPLSSDPLTRIPADRLASWPVSFRQRLALRIGSIVVSPVVWLALGILGFAGHWGFVIAVLLAAGVSQFLILLWRVGPPLRIPQIPGKLGGLLSHNLRQMACILDTYAALALAVGGLAYRVFSTAVVDPMAAPVLAMLVALTLSTYAQCLFGLDLESSAMLRYRLLPLRGWEILWAKDAVFLGVLLVLILPLDVPAGLTFGLASLTVGHHTSVLVRAPQQRWRFTGGRVLAGVLQGFLGFLLGFAEVQRGFVVCALAFAAYAVSLWIYGRVWDRRLLGT
jgi:hypothetical protein